MHVSDPRRNWAARCLDAAASEVVDETRCGGRGRKVGVEHAAGLSATACRASFSGVDGQAWMVDRAGSAEITRQESRVTRRRDSGNAGGPHLVTGTTFVRTARAAPGVRSRARWSRPAWRNPCAARGMASVEMQGRRMVACCMSTPMLPWRRHDASTAMD
eukprot:357108-Chlamydomonas_euryale.AAC.2